MLDLVGNPEDRFSRVEAHMLCVHAQFKFFSSKLNPKMPRKSGSVHYRIIHS